MFELVIVPLDGSEDSARALGPALKVARALASPLHLVTFAAADENAEGIRAAHRARLASLPGNRRVDTVIHVEQPAGPDAPLLETWLDDWPGALVVMATHGRGRSAAVLGSVATDVIRHRSGPVLLIGPAVRPERFEVDAPMLIPLDGTPEAERIMPIAEAWAIVFHNDLELMQVVRPAVAAAFQARTPEILFETAYLQRIAAKAEAALGRLPNYDTFHEDHAGPAIVHRAAQLGAGLVAMSTHGLTGSARLLHGSVMAEVAHRSACPVLTVRPPAIR